MRSAQLPLDRYGTDKIANRYIEHYDPILEPWVHKEIRLLEIGISRGGSLLLWRDYFPLGTIVGVDIRLPSDFVPGERIHVFEGGQSDLGFLSGVASRMAPEGFDIIIDDASHIGELTKKAFWHLFDFHLKPGGLYAIEDWGTGYWDDWPDGMAVRSNTQSRAALWPKLRSKLKFRQKEPVKTPFSCHSYGMVGFIKELVDEVGAADLTRALFTGKAERQSKFDSVLILPSMAVVKKSTHQSQWSWSVRSHSRVSPGTVPPIA